MSNSNRTHGILIGLAISVLFCAVVSIDVRAQDTSTTTVAHGPSEYDTTVRNAEVVYVSGNDLVVKLDDGRVEHFRVPDSDKFTVDGKDVTVHELKPGTKLTQTVVTKTTPHMVTTVRTIEGTIFHVTPPHSVILRFNDGGTKRYSIPSGQKFNIDGQDKTAFELKKGMKISATVVTDEPQTVMERTKSVVGQAPRPEAPAQVGALLIYVPVRALVKPEETTTASNENLPKKLPKTGTELPLIGLLGLLSIGASLTLKILHQQ